MHYYARFLARNRHEEMSGYINLTKNQYDYFNYNMISNVLVNIYYNEIGIEGNELLETEFEFLDGGESFTPLKYVDYIEDKEFLNYTFALEEYFLSSSFEITRLQYVIGRKMRNTYCNSFNIPEEEKKSKFEKINTFFQELFNNENINREDQEELKNIFNIYNKIYITIEDVYYDAEDCCENLNNLSILNMLDEFLNEN